MKLTEASLPYKHKRPAKIPSGNKAAAYDVVCVVKTFNRHIYFNVNYTVVNCIVDQITQTGYQASRKSYF